MKKTFVISFCNNKDKIQNNSIGYIGLLDVDVQTQEITYKDIKLKLPENITGNGITGMCIHNKQLVLLLQRMPSTLLFLNTDYETVDYWQLDSVKGVHSILSDNEHIYLSVTNQDKVLKVFNTQNIEEIWSNSTNKDTIHLNSICFHNNNIYATAFGEKKQGLWSSVQYGTAFSLKSSEVMISNIWHPHSLVSYNGDLYCCDSSNQRVIGLNQELIKNLPGYSRGLFIDDDMIICGSSEGRLVSHSTGIKISNKSDKGTLAGECGITVNFKKQNNTVFINLKDTAVEVFDILELI